MILQLVLHNNAQHQRLAQPRCLPLTQRKSEAGGALQCRSGGSHCYFPLDHLNVFVFPRSEMPLWKRKEAKEKGLSEPTPSGRDKSLPSFRSFKNWL